MARLMGVSYGAGHANIVAAVTHELHARGHDVHLVGLTTAAGAFARAGLSSIGFRDLIREDDEEAHAWGQRLSAGTPSHPDVPAGETEAYLGLSYCDLVNEHGEAVAADLYEKHGRQCLVPRTALRRAFDLIDPDAVFTTNSPRAEAAAVYVARERGVPCTVVVDFLLGFDLERLQAAGYGDRVCVLTGGVRQRLLSLGRRADEVLVTGNPSFDSLHVPDLALEVQRWKEHFEWSTRPVALWISQPEPGNPSFGLKVAREIRAHLSPEWILAIRPHPNDPFGRDDCPKGIEWIGPEISLPIALGCSDAVIVIASTVGVQAALLGKPLCVLEVPAASEPVPFVEMGLGYPAIGVQEVPAVLERLRSGDCPDPNGLPEIGRATQNVADVIESTLRA